MVWPPKSVQEKEVYKIARGQRFFEIAALDDSTADQPHFYHLSFFDLSLLRGRFTHS